MGVGECERASMHEWMQVSACVCACTNGCGRVHTCVHAQMGVGKRECVHAQVGASVCAYRCAKVDVKV